MRSEDLRDKRRSHIEQSDKVLGEYGSFDASPLSYELPDANLMDKIIDNVRFKDIPVMQIVCTRNNTKMIVYHQNKTLFHKTAGTEGYKHCRKGTTVAAQAVAKRMLTCAKDNNVDKVRLQFNGLGPGRDAAFKVLEMSDLKIVSLSDRTQAAEPYNLRPRKRRRI